MNEPPRGRAGWTRWAFRIAAALVAVAVALAAAIHAPPVRRYALRRAVATLEERYDLRLRAEALDYNLLALRVTLTGLRVAARGADETPFFIAERVTARLPTSAVLGPFAIERIDVTGGRLHVVRDASGGSNLPASGGGTGEPAALDIGVLAAPRLAVEISDDASGVRLRLPATDVELGGASRVELVDPGHVARGDTSATIHELHGGVAFDGRTFTLTGVSVGTEEFEASVTGTLAALVASPRMDLRLVVEADTADLARWGRLDDPPAGAIALDAVVAGPFAAPTAAGTIRAARLEWRGVAASAVRATVRFEDNVVRVERLEAQMAGGAIAARGRVPLTGGDAEVHASWDGLDLAELASLASPGLSPRPAGRATGTLEARGPVADPGRWSGTMTSRVAAVTGGPNRVDVNGHVDLRIDGGRWRLAAHARAAELPVEAALGGRLRVDDPSQTTVAGRVVLPPAALLSVIQAAGRAGLDLDRVTLAADEPGTIEAVATIGGTLGRPEIRFEGRATIADAGALAPDTPLAGAATIRFEGDRREVRFDAELPDLPATARAVVSTSAPYIATVDVEVTSAQLERLLAGVDVPVRVAGSVSASAHARGTLDRWQDAEATLEVTTLDARAGALPLSLAVPARIAYEAGRIDVRSLELQAGGVRVSAAGADPIVVTATGDLARFTTAIVATGAVDVPDVSGTGPAAVLARITGLPGAPQVVADVELGPGTIRSGSLPAATNVHLRLHSDGTWIDLRELTGEWQGSRMTARGRVPVSQIRDAGSAVGDPQIATLDASVTSITPAVLAPFVDAETLAQIDGSVDATLHVEAASRDLAALAGEIRLDRMDVRVAGLPVAQREPTRVALGGGFARVTAWQWAGQGASVGLEGQVRLSDWQAALLADARVDLRMIAPFVRAAGITAAGSFAPRLSITGPLDDPRIDGVAAITDADVRLADPRVVATGLDGRVVLSRTRAQLSSLTGTINGGALSATGAVEYGAGAPIDAAFRIEAEGMALEFPAGLRTELNADLAVSLQVPPSDPASGSVTGTVTVLRGGYRETLAVVTGLLGTLRTERLAAQAARGEPSIGDAIALDVRVVTEDDLVVDNNVGQLQLGADLRVIGTAAAPSVAGRAELREGGRVFLGRNIYTIESGTIDFANPATIEPDLHLEARTRAGGVDIVLTLDGTPSALESSLAAPDAAESYGQADLASLLLTGRTLENVYGDEARVVGEQVLGYLSGDVLGLAGRAVGLDTVRLGGIDEAMLRRDFTDAATELDPTSRLTFGKSFGRHVDVTFSQSLRDGDAQAWIVDVRPWRRVEFRLLSNDENLRSYGFRHDVSFGANANVLAGPAPAAARARREQAAVAAVRFEGDLAMPEGRLRDAIRHDAGETFDFIAWQRDRERIEALYRADGRCEARIGARRIEEPSGVTLAYGIEPGPRCVLEVAGQPLAAETRARLMAAWTASVFDRFLEEEATAIVAAALARDGYYAAQVASEVRDGDGSRTLAIRIDPGPRGGEPVVRVDTADPALAAELAAWVRDAGLAQAAAAEPGRVAREMTAMLRARGYLRADVAVAPPRLDGAATIVPIRVDAGPVFSIADVRIAGAGGLPAASVQQAVGLTPGQPYDPAAVESARERLAARYRREGFTQAQVTVAQEVEEARPAVAVTFHASAGPRQVLAEVRVEGNRAIDEDVIVRAMALPVGEPVTADAWLQARTRLFATNLFRRVDVQAVPVEPAPADAAVQPMRARVTVQEWPLLRLRYGFQVAEERPEAEPEGRDLVPGLSADLTRRTLFGRAVSLGAAFDYERRARRGRGFVNAPTLLGWPIASSLVGQWSRNEFTTTTLVTDVSSVSWEQRIRAARHLQLSYAYRFERNHTFDTSPPVDPNAPSFDSIVLDIGRLNVIGAWDTRDDPGDTTRGMLLSSSLEYAPEMLGADIRFARFVGQAYYFRPWRRLVFASAARIGLASGLEGQDLIPSERFVTGGARSVRGAAEDSLAPRDIFGIPGGEALLVLNHEVRFPIYRWVRGVGFLDAGNVFERISQFDAGGLVGAYGVGLRADTPIGLFRVDFGRLFSPGADSRSGRWNFGIGHAF